VDVIVGVVSPTNFWIFALSHDSDPRFPRYYVNSPLSEFISISIPLPKHGRPPILLRIVLRTMII